MDAAKCVIPGGGPKQGVPLADILGRADVLRIRQQGVVLDIDHAGGLIGPLDHHAHLVEAPAFVPEEGPLHDAGMGLAPLLDGGAQPGQVLFGNPVGSKVSQPFVERIEMRPHLGADQRPQGAGVLPGGPDHRADGLGAVQIQQRESDHAGLVRLLVFGGKGLLVGVQVDNGRPGAGAGFVAGEGGVDVDHPRQVFRPLHIARHPEAGVGVAGQKPGHRLRLP